MQLAGVRVDRKRRNFKPTPAWTDLLARLPERARGDLHRFAGYCSTLNIEPDEVTAAVHDRFMEDMVQQSLQRRPRERAHVARRAWNRFVALDGAGYARLPEPEYQRQSCIRWEDFPESFRADFERYVEAVTKDRLFRKRKKQIKPITLVGYRKQILWFASRLVEAGVPIGTLTNLRELVRVDYFERGLEAQLGERNFHEASASLHAMATALLSVARFSEVAPEHLEQLRGLAREVRHSPNGMCTKVRERLSQFEDPAMAERLFCLPIAVAQRLEKVTKPTRSQAADMQMACLAEILLHVPMRIKNAAELVIGRNIIPAASSSGRWRIAIPAADVKNGQPIDDYLTNETSEMLVRYVEVFRPVLSSTPSAALFESTRGGPKSPKHLSNQFKHFVRRETGLILHAHMMRHFFAYQYLCAFPGEYEVVRSALRHTNVSTTVKFYSGFETKNDLARYEQMIARLRGRK